MYIFASRLSMELRAVAVCPDTEVREVFGKSVNEPNMGRALRHERTNWMATPARQNYTA